MRKNLHNKSERFSSNNSSSPKNHAIQKNWRDSRAKPIEPMSQKEEQSIGGRTTYPQIYMASMYMKWEQIDFDHPSTGGADWAYSSSKSD